MQAGFDSQALILFGVSLAAAAPSARNILGDVSLPDDTARCFGAPPSRALCSYFVAVNCPAWVVTVNLFRRSCWAKIP